ncbi:hypothetical protein BDW22DRAFT_1353422 [Trametopsis cervina]|nr:hypothetical protein BDW22DRAFT_1353422 [Trametopsis cervina]
MLSKRRSACAITLIIEVVDAFAVDVDERVAEVSPLRRMPGEWKRGIAINRICEQWLRTPWSLLLQNDIPR